VPTLRCGRSAGVSRGVDGAGGARGAAGVVYGLLAAQVAAVAGALGGLREGMVRLVGWDWIWEALAGLPARRAAELAHARGLGTGSVGGLAVRLVNFGSAIGIIGTLATRIFPPRLPHGRRLGTNSVTPRAQ